MMEQTKARMFERAKILGYNTTEECIEKRISAGGTINTVAGQLDVSPTTLYNIMQQIGVKPSHKQGRVRFWLPRRHEE